MEILEGFGRRKEGVPEEEFEQALERIRNATGEAHAMRSLSASQRERLELRKKSVERLHTDYALTKTATLLALLASNAFLLGGAASAAGPGTQLAAGPLFVGAGFMGGAAGRFFASMRAIEQELAKRE